MGWAKRTRLIVTVVAIALVLAACGSANSEDSAPTSAPAPAPPSTPTTTLPPATTSAPTTSTTTTTVVASTTPATETVGDPDLYLEEATQVINDFIFGISGPDEVPLPDVTNPDAAVALQSIYEFEWWTFTNAPNSSWPDIFTLPPTQVWVEASNVSGRLFRVAAVFEFRGDPYRFHAARVVGVADADVPAGVLDEFPSGSVVVEFESSVGPYEMVTPETGQVWDTFAGWERKPRYVVMAPTESGWRVAWEGPVE